jgi:4-amino-4-deoxy-L-arabinose transferase-like glycosyltransferase
LDRALVGSFFQRCLPSVANASSWSDGAPVLANRFQTSDLRLAAPRCPGWLLLALLLVCFIPRAAMTWRLDVICPDATLYISMGEALERGDVATAFSLQLNIYPVILAGLHRLGLSWEMAGRLWGMLASTLVVLPLFGWVRRQFDVRIAVIACLLYAAHPELIEWTPEGVRDATFWLFFTLSIYLTWRAVADLRLWSCAAAGAAIALAVLTRFEGLFLLLLAAGWTIARSHATPAIRWRLARNLLISALALPMALLVMNLVWMGGQPHWELFRTEPIVRGWHWLTAWFKSPQTVVPSDAENMATIGLSSDVRWSSFYLLWQFLHIMERGLTPIYGLLLLVGCAVNRRRLWAGDQWPLVMLCAAICAGIWVHLWYTHSASSRYSLAIVIVATPTIAVGLLEVCHRLRRRYAKHERWSKLAQRSPLVVLSLLIVAGWIDALSTGLEGRQTSASLGRWICGHFSSQPLILGSDDQLPVVNYYAHGRYSPLPRGMSDDSLRKLILDYHPDVVVLSPKRACSDFAMLLRGDAGLGLAPIDEASLPDAPKKFVVLAREETARR